MGFERKHQNKHITIYQTEKFHRNYLSPPLKNNLWHDVEKTQTSPTTSTKQMRLQLNQLMYT
jgi:hypothetical protein